MSKAKRRAARTQPIDPVRLGKHGVPSGETSALQALAHFMTHEQVSNAALIIATAARAGTYRPILDALRVALNESALTGS